MKFLDRVELALYCPLAWEELTGEGSTRLCGECQERVTDLSAMTRAEAEALLASGDAPACVRVEVDADRRSVHRPEPARAAVRRARPAAAALSVALLAPAKTCVEAELEAPPAAVHDSCTFPRLMFEEAAGGEVEGRYVIEGTERERRAAAERQRALERGRAEARRSRERSRARGSATRERPSSPEPEGPVFMGRISYHPDYITEHSPASTRGVRRPPPPPNPCAEGPRIEQPERFGPALRRRLGLEPD